MKLLYIELYLYKPFLHHKTKHVTIDNLSHVTVISGENACGKSSLLRAISPYPSISTEFEKGGYKKLVYDHAGSIYEISSDFRKATGAHSFIKDGVELNESGTTDVQNNLVKDYLQYDDVVEKLVTGKYKICDMTKVDRRVLFMETYPSSMGFILDHYKQVSSRLRAVTNNIKMLNQRKIALEQQLVTPIILSDYRKEKDDLVKAIAKLDLDIYTVNKAIESGKQSLASTDSKLLSLTPEYFHQKCFNIAKDYHHLCELNKGAMKCDDISAELATTQTLIDGFENDIRDNENEARELNKELAEYKKYLSTDTETQIKDCKAKIQVQEQIIQNTKIDHDVPDISDYELEYLEKNIDTILENLSYLKQHGNPYLSEQEYNDILQYITNHKIQLSSLNRDINQLQETIVPVRNKLERFKTRTYPTTCTMNCVLRDDYKSLIDSVREQYTEIQGRLDDLYKQRDVVQNELTRMENVYNEVLPEKEVLHNLDVFFSRVSYSEYVTSGSFIDAMNKDSTEVYNRVCKVLEHAKAAKFVKNAKDTLTLLQTKLTSLESGSGQARQLIADSVLKKEAKLNETIEYIKNVKEYLKDLENDKRCIKIYQLITKQLNELEQEYSSLKKIYFLKAEINHFSGFLQAVNESKNKINEKLRELEQIIKEQDNYLVRLNDEINPELEKLKKQQTELSAVESQLSPTKGLSHVYIIRYINSIFRLANQFISRVWSYPMALEYIDENDESFDYSFKLNINESSSIKDINIASAGQKSIINLCVMLAICIFRHYGNDYPIILDEVTVNMSLNHQNSLITFLNELFSDEGLRQIFIVDHCIDVCSSFASIAEMICLSRDFDIGQEWKRIGAIE